MYSMQEKNALECAAKIIESKLTHQKILTSSHVVKDYCRYSLTHYEHEVFFMLLLDCRHRLITSVELFRGTIDSASVYPREVVKESLSHNASAVIFSHNHPSGCPEPSAADGNITKTLKAALELVDIRVLDHIVVGSLGCVSFAERGLL